MTGPIVVAYSGDPAATGHIADLARTGGAAVVTLTLDLGGGRDVEEIRERALAAGAARAHVMDAREEFVRDFVLPTLRAGARVDGADPVGDALARSLVRRKLDEVAAIEQAGSVLDRFLIEATLWRREGTRYALTRSIDHSPDTPASVEISFARGVPTEINGIPMAMIELIECLSIIAGHHGVGRLVPAASHAEAPAAVVLHAALDALELSVLTPDAVRMKRGRAAAYAELIVKGQWFTQAREDLDALNTGALEGATGTVRVRLFKGTLSSTVMAAPGPIVATPA